MSRRRVRQGVENEMNRKTNLENEENEEKVKKRDKENKEEEMMVEKKKMLMLKNSFPSFYSVSVSYCHSL
jgi:hypothetical protein